MVRCDKCGSLELHPMTTMFHWDGDSYLKYIGKSFITVTFLCNNCQTLKTIRHNPESSELS